MGASGGGSSTTNTVSEPWSKQQAYLGGGDTANYVQNKDGTYSASGKYTNPGIFDLAWQSYQNGDMSPDYYSGNTVADQSKYTTNAYNVVNNQATKGDNSYNSMGNAMTAENNVMKNGISGNTGLTNLNKVGDTNANNTGLSALESMTTAVNPYSKTLLNNAIEQQTGELNGNYSSAGRYGSGAHENAVASAAENLTNDFYSNAYDQQLQAANDAASAYNTGVGNNIAAMNDAATQYNSALGNINTAAVNAKDLYNQRYTDAQWLSDIGANQENYNQAKIDADVDRWNYDQQKAMNALSNYNQFIQGTYGGVDTSTGKSGYTGSALGSALGGATAAASLGSIISQYYNS